MEKSILYQVVGIVLGMLVLWIAPEFPSYFANVIVGNLIFWSSLLILTFKFLKPEVSLIRSKISKLTLSIFTGYLALHYFVYSIALEKLLTGIYGVLFHVSSPFLAMTYSPFYPSSPLTLFYNIILNPAIVGGFPPNYYFELSFYALSMGLVIATLVTANILKVLQYSSMLKRTKVIILAPLFGVIGGGSCCISIPILLAEAIPAANVVFFSPIGDTALFLAYVLLPPLTAIALKLNFDSMKPKIPKNFRISYGSLEQREKTSKEG